MVPNLVCSSALIAISVGSFNKRVVGFVYFM